MLDILLAGDSSNLWEGEFQKNLFLIIHNIDPRPVHSDYHIVLRQVGAYQFHLSVTCHYQSTPLTWVAECLVKSGEKQRPLIFGITDHVFLRFQVRHSLFHIITLNTPRISQKFTSFCYFYLEKESENWPFWKPVWLVGASGPQVCPLWGNSQGYSLKEGS